MFTFRRYHRILHTCQELNEKEKKTQIYTALFLALHHHTDAYINLKKKKIHEYSYLQTFLQIYKQINFSFSKKKKGTAENTGIVL